MRCLTKYQIKKMNCVIPNLENFPSITVSQNTTEDGYTYTEYRWTPPDGDPFEKLLTLVSNNEYIECINYHNTVAIKAGLFIKPAYTWLAILDALYYTCNPVKFKKEISHETIEKLIVRLDNRAVAGRSVATKVVVNKIVDKVMEGITKPTTSSTLEEIKEYQEKLAERNYTLSYHVRFDIVRLEWLDNSCVEYIETRVGKFYVSKQENSYPRYNLTKYSDSTNNSTFSSTLYTSRLSTFYINTDTELVYNGAIYLRSELSLSHCHACGAEHITSAITEDGCPTCLKDIGKIHSYSTKVPELLKFKATKVTPKTIYLGTELEYESKDDKNTDAIYATRSLKGHAILKSDGSIRNGFEIVTCPATLDIHLAEFKKFFEGLKTKSKLHGQPNTGMHVHVSRKPLSLLTIGKMSAFLNEPSNKDFVEKIAGRKLNNYCQQDTRAVTFPLVNGERGGARYNVLNLNNSETVELRIFSTPESFEDFAYKLEFAEALAIYCSPCSVNHSVYALLKASNFITWANSMKHTYPNLVTKLKTI